MALFCDVGQTRQFSRKVKVVVAKIDLFAIGAVHKLRRSLKISTPPRPLCRQVFLDKIMQYHTTIDILPIPFPSDYLRSLWTAPYSIYGF